MNDRFDTLVEKIRQNFNGLSLEGIEDRSDSGHTTACISCTEQFVYLANRFGNQFATFYESDYGLDMSMTVDGMMVAMYFDDLDSVFVKDLIGHYVKGCDGRKLGEFLDYISDNGMSHDCFIFIDAM